MKLNYRNAVLAIIMNEDQNFLLVKEDSKGQKWGFIQGGIEGNESPKEALLRELKEELGVTDCRVILECKYENTYDYPKILQMKHKIRGQKQKIFLVKVNSRTRLSPWEEIKEFKWVNRIIAEKLLPYKNLITFKNCLKEWGELI